MSELSKRAAQKRQKKSMSELKKMEKKLKTVKTQDLSTHFPELDPKKLDGLSDLLDGKFIGRDICHIWYDRDTQENTVYHGRVEKLCGLKYEVGYWLPQDTYDDAEDHEMSKYSLAADLIQGDLVVV